MQVATEARSWEEGICSKTIRVVGGHGKELILLWRVFHRDSNSHFAGALSLVIEVAFATIFTCLFTLLVLKIYTTYIFSCRIQLRVTNNIEIMGTVDEICIFYTRWHYQYITVEIVRCKCHVVMLDICQRDNLKILDILFQRWAKIWSFERHLWEPWIYFFKKSPAEAIWLFVQIYG